MSDGHFALLDLAIAGVPAIAWGVWQLVSVNREIARDKARRDDSPESAGHPVGEHGLDDR